MQTESTTSSKRQKRHVTSVESDETLMLIKHLSILAKLRIERVIHVARVQSGT